MMSESVHSKFERISEILTIFFEFLKMKILWNLRLIEWSFYDVIFDILINQWTSNEHDDDVWECSYQIWNDLRVIHNFFWMNENVNFGAASVTSLNEWMKMSNV